MKKRLPIIILALLILLLSVYLIADYSNDPEESSFAILYEDPPPGYSITREPFGANSLLEYKTCLKLLSKDTELITYDALKTVGFFKSFYYHAAWTQGEYGSYSYGFTDRNGYYYYLYVRADTGYSESSDSQVIEQVADETDLRKIGAEDNGTFYVGDIRYKYEDGVLERITWYNDTHYFSLTVNDSKNKILSYDLESNTFISRLLNAETAQQTVADFNARAACAIAFRKTGNVRIIGQWAVAAGMLIWGVFQLLNVPVELRKTIKGIEDEKLRRSCRRQCGVIKIAAAAVFACMGFVELSQPIFAIGFILVYCALLALLLWQQKLTNRKFLTTPECVQGRGDGSPVSSKGD